ncbi:tetratricopeptide repeat protein [Massilia sp. TS11]|uniref:tetratricopeptide repeat protein n=1 Tax=Massilia sp. TS11 TaxID=2908003 RepID=UPI001EDBA02D|nr:hypothetical protein [Massilia sp. TS11]MCG2585758.1 hypothetical protein [Massilia sp. TS11]
MSRLSLSTGLRVLGALALAGAIWACDLNPPERPAPAEILALSQAANEGQQHAAELRLRHWAGAGVAAARRELGRLWLRRPGMQRDAFHQYELAARDGDAEAALVLGNWLRNSPDARQALRWYQLAAAQGQAEAALALGQMALGGEGMAPDPALAMRWLQRAAQLGNAEAISLVSVDRGSVVAL